MSKREVVLVESDDDEIIVIDNAPNKENKKKRPLDDDDEIIVLSTTATSSSSSLHWPLAAVLQNPSEWHTLNDQKIREFQLKCQRMNKKSVCQGALTVLPVSLLQAMKPAIKGESTHHVCERLGWTKCGKCKKWTCLACGQPVEALPTCFLQSSNWSQQLVVTNAQSTRDWQSEENGWMNILHTPCPFSRTLVTLRMLQDQESNESGPSKRATPHKAQTTAASGTGYAAGHYSQNQKQLQSQIESVLNQRSQQDQRVITWMRMTLAYLESCYDNQLQHIYFDAAVKASFSLRQQILAVLRNDAMDEMATRHELYHETMRLIRRLARRDSLLAWMWTVESASLDDSTSSVSMLSLLSNLVRQTDVFIDAVSDQASQVRDQKDGSLTVAVARKIEAVHAFVTKRTQETTQSASSSLLATSKASPEQTYVETLTPLLFDHFDLISSGFYYANLLSSGGSSAPGPRTLRLAKEIATISTSLSCSLQSSIFVRCDENRVDCLRVLIIGPDDTPYANGVFLFDVYVPETYPQGPPLVIFRTTGGGQVRFNPNLYACGKVCLSLLGTWQAGHASEGWQPLRSTLMQVFLSIQSFILIERPYYNEPGHGSWPQSRQESENYDNRVRLDCVRVAILDVIKAVIGKKLNTVQQQMSLWLKPFDPVVKDHFLLKREAIEKQLEQWTRLQGAPMRQLTQEWPALMKQLENI